MLKKRRLAKAFAAEYPMDGREAISVVSKYFQALKRVYPRYVENNSGVSDDSSDASCRSNLSFQSKVVM